MAEAQLDSQGRPWQLQHNLDDEFVHVDGHDVYKTPSANLVVAANELAWLPQTPEVTKVTTMIKEAHYQVNEIRQDQRPSYSTTSIRRLAATRTDRRQSRFTDQPPPTINMMHIGRRLGASLQTILEEYPDFES